MINKDKYPMYALAAVAGAAIAVWAGPPPTVLLVLICPAMMFIMMRGMSNMSSRDKTNDQDVAKHADSAERDGSHERIDQP